MIKSKYLKTSMEYLAIPPGPIIDYIRQKEKEQSRKQPKSE